MCTRPECVPRRHGGRRAVKVIWPRRRADYYAIRPIVIQLLHPVIPVFARRNCAARAKYLTGRLPGVARNSTRMQIDTFADIQFARTRASLPH